VISCLMPTFNRYPQRAQLVEEAVESFLRQIVVPPHDTELLICNDTPGQTLAFDHPRVRVLNVPQRFPTLAKKLRWLIDQASGDLLCRWDDDDISLPWRLHLSVDQLGDRLEWHPSNYWYCPPGKVHHDAGHGNDHIQAIFRRELLDRIGGYPDGTWSGHEDADFTDALKRAGLWERGPELPPEQIFYLYRWGISQHLSGRGGGATMQETYERLGANPIAAETFTIVPQWRQDYVSLVRPRA